MSNTCCKDIFVSKWSGWSHKCGKPAKFEVGGKFYCGIHNPDKPETKSQIKAREDLKNSRYKWKLQAAAPEMLGALEMVRDADNDCKRDGLPCIPTFARQKIDEAIAKATGEAS